MQRRKIILCHLRHKMQYSFAITIGRTVGPTIAVKLNSVICTNVCINKQMEFTSYIPRKTDLVCISVYS